MSYSTALLILFICSVLAVVVAAPFIYMARRRRKSGSSHNSWPEDKKITFAQAVPGLLLVVLMFFAFAHQFIAPDSWLGSRVTTEEGKFWFSVLIFLVFFVLNYMWTLVKRRKQNKDQD